MQSKHANPYAESAVQLTDNNYAYEPGTPTNITNQGDFYRKVQILINYSYMHSGQYHNQSYSNLVAIETHGRIEWANDQFPDLNKKTLF